MSTFTCPDHGTLLRAGGDGCGWCAIDLRGGPRAEHMDREGRTREIMRLLDRPMTVRFGLIWRRLDHLAGRPLHSHEVMEPERIAQEVRTGAEPEHPLTSLRRVVEHTWRATRWP